MVIGAINTRPPPHLHSHRFMLSQSDTSSDLTCLVHTEKRVKLQRPRNVGRAECDVVAHGRPKNAFQRRYRGRQHCHGGQYSLHMTWVVQQSLEHGTRRKRGGRLLSSCAEPHMLLLLIVPSYSSVRVQMEIDERTQRGLNPLRGKTNVRRRVHEYCTIGATVVPMIVPVTRDLRPFWPRWKRPRSVKETSDHTQR